jgi:WhiB family redox-sensing transcriptional regulator
LVKRLNNIRKQTKGTDMSGRSATLPWADGNPHGLIRPITRSAPRARPVEPDWNQAACRGTDPDLFFKTAVSGGRGGASVTLDDEAKAICNSPCPIRLGCLRWAMDSGITDGVFGGVSADDRRSMKRSLARAKAKAASE